MLFCCAGFCCLGLFRFFFNNKKPAYYYKSSKFYFLFLRARRRYSLGLRAGRGYKSSYFFRMHYLRRFFLWYYNVKTNFRFRKLMRNVRKAPVSSRYGRFFQFFFVIERQLAVVLFRLLFVRSLRQAHLYVRSGAVYINGVQKTNPFYVVPVGGVVEVITHKLGAYLLGLSLLFGSFRFVRLLLGGWRKVYTYGYRPPVASRGHLQALSYSRFWDSSSSLGAVGLSTPTKAESTVGSSVSVFWFRRYSPAFLSNIAFLVPAVLGYFWFSFRLRGALRLNRQFYSNVFLYLLADLSKVAAPGLVAGGLFSEVPLFLDI